MAADLLTRTIRTDRGDARERLDLVLVRHLADRPEISRSQIQAWIEAGRARVNGAVTAKPSARVAQGAEIEIALPPPPPPRPAPAAEERALSILFEDEHLLAVDKPPDLVAHPSPGHRAGTLLNALMGYARDWEEGRRPSLANRLDRDTSGVLLVAKTPAVHATLARHLRRRDARKEYLAAVYGSPPTDEGRIELRLLRDPADRKRVIASKTEGLASVTLWERLEEGNGLTLLGCRLLTGRTHQIRVHLKARGWPIVGDPVYGEPRYKGIADPALAALCRDFPRQALHARRIAFAHPATGAPMEIVAPVPADMAGLLAAAFQGRMGSTSVTK